MQKFIKRSDAFAKFLEWRKKLNEASENSAKFEKLFAEAVKKAGDSDAIMQDVVAYYYKSGVEGVLDENYKKYMNFEILAGAQGNEFAIEKLQFFLGNAYDRIVESAEFPQIKYYNDIDEFNYISIIGQRICAALVEKLELNAQTLSKTTDEYDPYLPEYFRDYRKAVDEVVPKVIKEMAQKQN